jgi:MULE transposase domain
LDVERTFNLDELPANFGARLSPDDGLSGFSNEPLNQAVAQLAEVIWKEGGFRFYRHSTQASLLATFYCCQDQARERQSTSRCIRDANRMTRYQCQSSLTMSTSLDDRTLALRMRHAHHEPYDTPCLTPEAIRFVDSLVLTSTAAEIWRKLGKAKVPGHEDVTESQVYYRWVNANVGTWRRHQDPLVSAELLLADNNEVHNHEIFTSGNVRGLAMFLKKPMRTLASEAKELAMDATFGTNNAGMDLYAVLAEVDGAGIPLAYLFLEVQVIDGTRRADAGAVTHVLDQFLRRTRASGFNPTFFGVDKDTAEISAIRQVWPEANIQLCI